MFGLNKRKAKQNEKMERATSLPTSPISHMQQEIDNMITNSYNRYDIFTPNQKYDIEKFYNHHVGFLVNEYTHLPPTLQTEQLDTYINRLAKIKKDLHDMLYTIIEDSIIYEFKSKIRLLKKQRYN